MLVFLKDPPVTPWARGQAAQCEYEPPQYSCVGFGESSSRRPLVGKNVLEIILHENNNSIEEYSFANSVFGHDKRPVHSITLKSLRSNTA